MANRLPVSVPPRAVVRAFGVLAVGLLVWPVASAHGQAALLTIDDCVRLAREAPSTVTAARRALDISELRRRQARAAFLPQSRLDAGYIYNSPSASDRSAQSFIALDAIHAYSMLVTAGTQLDTSGRLRAALARARADREAATIGVALSERDLRRSVSVAYYQLLLTRHLADALRDLVREAESFEQRTTQLVTSGEAARADLVKASAELAALRQELNSAELDATLANQTLAAFWTTDVDDPVKIVDVFEQPLQRPEPPPPSTGDTPYLGRLEFDLFNAQQRSLLAESHRLRAGLLPQGTVSFQYGLDSDRVSAHDRGYALFAGFTVPLFDWFSTINAANSLRRQADQVAIAQQIAERAFSQAYASAGARVRATFTNVDLARNRVTLSTEDLRLSRIRFEGGEGAAIDVVTAQSQLALARIDYYTSLAAYWTARADLEVAAGR